MRFVRERAVEADKICPDPLFRKKRIDLFMQRSRIIQPKDGLLSFRDTKKQSFFLVPVPRGKAQDAVIPRLKIGIGMYEMKAQPLRDRRPDLPPRPLFEDGSAFFIAEYVSVSAFMPAANR